MADFRVKIYLPENPETNLAEMVPASGIGFDFKAPIPPETENDVIMRDFLNYFVKEGIVPADRRGDVVFDFE